MANMDVCVYEDERLGGMSLGKVERMMRTAQRAGSGVAAMKVSAAPRGDAYSDLNIAGALHRIAEEVLAGKLRGALVILVDRE